MMLDLISSNQTLLRSCNFETHILKSNYFLSTVKKHECHITATEFHLLSLYIIVQLQVTVLYINFLLAGKSKQTRGVFALRGTGLTGDD